MDQLPAACDWVRTLLAQVYTSQAVASLIGPVVVPEGLDVPGRAPLPYLPVGIDVARVDALGLRPPDPTLMGVVLFHPGVAEVMTSSWSHWLDEMATALEDQQIRIVQT